MIKAIKMNDFTFDTCRYLRYSLHLGWLNNHPGVYGKEVTKG